MQGKWYEGYPFHGWNGISRVFPLRKRYFLRNWGTFQRVFILLIGCSGNAWFSGMVRFRWDVLSSLRSLGGGRCRENGMRVTDSMARPG